MSAMALNFGFAAFGDPREHDLIQYFPSVLKSAKDEPTLRNGPDLPARDGAECHCKSTFCSRPPQTYDSEAAFTAWGKDGEDIPGHTRISFNTRACSTPVSR